MHEILYTITILALAVALIFSWREIVKLREKNHHLKIDYHEKKDLAEWWKIRYEVLKIRHQNIPHETKI